MENDKCPLCAEYSSRLINERCGHSKCRKCFIEDEFGCRNCLDNSHIVSKQNQKQELPLIIEKNDVQVEIISNLQCKKEHLIEEAGELNKQVICARGQNSKPSNKQKVTRTTKIPSHVIRQRNTEGALSYKCTVCDKEFSSRSQQYYHLYCNESSKKPFCCRVCLKRFSSSYHLKYHEESHNSSQTLKCPECYKIFTRRITLRQHLKQHERNSRFACSVCEATFKDKYAYRAHSDKHNNVFRFSCQSCEKKFSLKSSFKKHQIVHCNQTGYECIDCKKTFKRKESYKAHNISHHSDKKHFSCDQCSKSFADLRTLQRHKKIHDESKFYKCAFCSVKSKRKDNLSRHMRNMHPEQKSVTIFHDLSEEIVTEILPKPVAISDQSEEIIIGPSFLDTIAMGTPLPREPERYLQCSVIKSVGNAKPMVVSNNDDCKIQEAAANSEVNEGSNGLNAILKKRKKKYDPCEIYRKILLGSNDEDSMLESTQIEPPQEESNGKKTESNFEINAPSNFAEIHWRKRTSQYFSSINV